MGTDPVSDSSEKSSKTMRGSEGALGKPSIAIGIGGEEYRTIECSSLNS
jgi:hypothetical protein